MCDAGPGFDTTTGPGCDLTGDYMNLIPSDPNRLQDQCVMCRTNLNSALADDFKALTNQKYTYRYKSCDRECKRVMLEPIIN